MEKFNQHFVSQRASCIEWFLQTMEGANTLSFSIDCIFNPFCAIFDNIVSTNENKKKVRKYNCVERYPS